MNYKSFTEPYIESLGPFGDVIVSMLATIAAQDLIKISENTKAALFKKKAAGVKLGTPGKSKEQIEQFAGSRVAACQTTPSARAWASRPARWPSIWGKYMLGDYLFEVGNLVQLVRGGRVWIVKWRGYILV